MVELVIAIALVIGAIIWGVARILMALEGKQTERDFGRYD